MNSAFSSENQTHTWIPSKLPTEPTIPLPREPPKTNQSHLILKKSKSILSVSTADILVLHFTEIAHFHHESCFPHHGSHYLGGSRGHTTRLLQSPPSLFYTPLRFRRGYLHHCKSSSSNSSSSTRSSKSSSSWNIVFKKLECSI